MGDSRKYLKLPRINTVFNTKEEAIENVQEYIIDNISHFLDGESILIRFKNEFGKILSTTVIVNIDNEDNVSLSFNLDSEETIKIVETKNTPQDLDSLWLTDATIEDESEENKDNIIFGLKQRVESLEKIISDLSKLINKHEYALTHTISGGDFLTNSVKYDLENSIEAEKPSSATYGEVYSETNNKVSYFDLFIGYTNVHSLQKTKLYTGQYYYIKPNFYNEEGELINPNNVNFSLISESPDSVEAKYVESSKRWYIYANKKDNIIITAKVINEDETEVIDDYVLLFEDETEPTKMEPNVKHVLIKTAENFDILSANTKYLLLNEFVWCKSNNSLYFKAEASNGSINLFKINGGGIPGPDIPDIPDTGTTTQNGVSISSEGILEFNNETVYYNKEGEIVLSQDIAYLNEEGILIFNEKTNSNTINIIEDNLIIDNTIDSEGYLTLTNVEIDEEGYIIIK